MADVTITKQQWQEYRDIQDSGVVNMVTPQAREMTSLSKPEWIHILTHYSRLKKEFEGE